MPILKAVATALTVVVACAMPAMAQSTHEPRVAATFGIGRVNPIPAELPYTASTWSASVLVSAARHLLLEGVVTGWTHTASERADIDFSDATRTISRHGTLEQQDSKASVNVNVLATGTIKRVRLSSGVGVGRARFQTIFSQRFTDCVSSIPSFCRERPADMSRTWLFSMQAVLGVDVSLTSRIRASLTYRLSQPFATALGDVSVLTGFSVGLR